jgi:predicted oxidoreductase
LIKKVSERSSSTGIPVAIAGIKNVQQIAETAAAMQVTLTREEYYTIRRALQQTYGMGFPFV